MALNLPAAITVTANVQGNQALNILSRQLKELSASSQVSGRSLDRLYTETRKLGSAAGNTISSLRNQAIALRALRDEAEFGSRKFRLLTKDIEAVEQRLKRYQATASQTGGLSRGGALLAGFAGGIAGGVATMVAGKGMEAIGGITQAGLNAETAQVRLKALTDQFGEYNQAQAATARIAQTLRISQTEATDSFSQLYAALRPTGVTLKETEDAFIGFSAAARASGATSTETSAALLQLKQALGSGVLQGDELRSLREQAPLASQAIAREMGVTIGELKKLGSEGKITTDIVLRALASLKDTQLDKLNAQFDTGAQAIKDFQVASENLGKTLSRIFGPTTIALLRNVTRGLKDMTDVLSSMGGDKAAEANLQDRIRARDQAAAEAGSRFSLFDLGGKEAYFQRRQEELFQQLQQARTAAAPGDTVTAQQRQAQDAAARERQAARDRAATAAREDEVKIRQQAEEKLGDAVKQREQQIADFRLETIKRAKDLERELGDQRLKIEREIQASQLAAARAREDRALEGQLQSVRGQGGSTAGLEEAKATRELFRQFEDQVTQQRQTAFDRQQALQRQLEQFKVSIAEGIGKIQEAYARSVSNILQDAGDKLAKKMVDGANAAAGTLNSTTPSGGSDLVGANSQGRALTTAAGRLGVNPLDLATIIGFETAGTYSPSKRGGAGGNYMGLIQFGPNERKQYGANANQSFEEQVLGPVVRYFQDRFKSAGMSTQGADLLTLYRTVLGGNPRASLTARDAFGTSPASGVAAMGPHRLEAQRRFFGGTDGYPSLPSTGLDQTRSGVAQAGAQLSDATRKAQAEARSASFQGLMGGLDARLSGATAELDAQARSAKEKLEDERSYQILLSQGVTPELAQQRVDLERIAATEREKLTAQQQEIDKKIQSGTYSKEEVAVLEAQKVKIQERIDAQGRSIVTTEAEIDATKRLKKAREDAEGRDIGKGLQDGVKGYLESIGTLADGIKGVTGNALKGLEDQLVTFVTTGKASFKELAASILADMSRIIIQQMVLKPILKGIGSALGFSFADGGIMTADGPVPLRKYAGGGIASSPQLAMFGEGSMPEAYVPLPDGRRIPVAMRGGGGGSTNVTVNVDASGSQVQGDAGKGEMLGRVISQAVQQELIKQRRPGGLLVA